MHVAPSRLQDGGFQRVAIELGIVTGARDRTYVCKCVDLECAEQLQELPAYFIGVRCPVEEIMARRDAGAADTSYARSAPDGTVPEVVFRWERAVHHPGTYDLEVDTSRGSPEACAAAVARRLDEGPPVAFAELARGWA